MFAKETIEAIRSAARELNVEAAALLAVAEVESGGRAFVLVDGRHEPLIRFEAHYFGRRLPAGKREAARRAGLSSPEAGRIANPVSQTARWRMLGRAAAIDREAAYESTSWGIGQVMGAHWAWLGYADVAGLVEETRAGAAGQARLMARYIDKAGLAIALRAHDWKTFARGYNGPQYRKSGYHTKIEGAYERWRRAENSAQPAFSTLRPGVSGEEVSDVQLALTAIGYPLQADGTFGPATAAALRSFQEDQGLAVDGICGPATRAKLHEALARRGDSLWSRIARLSLGWLPTYWTGTKRSAKRTGDEWNPT
jgi:hypothetical protein